MRWGCPSVSLFVRPFVRLSQCRSPKCLHENATFSKSKQYKLWSLHRLFKEIITRPLKFKMAEICHLEHRQIAISQQKSSDFDEIWCTRADLELGDSHLTKYDFFSNSRWRTAAILKIVFGHNSATHCPISMKFCAG